MNINFCCKTSQVPQFLIKAKSTTRLHMYYEVPSELFLPSLICLPFSHSQSLSLYPVNTQIYSSTHISIEQIEESDIFLQIFATSSISILHSMQGGPTVEVKIMISSNREYNFILIMIFQEKIIFLFLILFQ